MKLWCCVQIYKFKSICRMKHALSQAGQFLYIEKQRTLESNMQTFNQFQRNFLSQLKVFRKLRRLPSKINFLCDFYFSFHRMDIRQLHRKLIIKWQ